MTRSAPAAPPASLAQYLRFLWRRKLALALPVVVAVGVAVAVTQRQTPVYESSTDLLFSATGSEGGTARDEVSVRTEARIATSPAVLAEAARSVGGGTTAASLAGAVRAGQVEDLAVLRITARDGSPGRARAMAAAVASAYLDIGRQRAEEDLARQTAAVTARLAELTGDLDRLMGELAAAEAAGQDAQAQALRSRRDLLVGDQAVQQARLHELRLAAASPAREASVLVPASAPGSPVSPRPARAAVIAGLVGLLAGFALALAQEHLVAHVRTAAEVEHALRSPVLAVVPRLRGRRARRSPLAVLDRPASQVAEAYRIVRSNLAVAGVGDAQRVLLVTSALAGEGKSTVAANLAVAFAESGVDTMLVDADLRRPRLHQLLDLPNGRGLSSVLEGRLHPAEAAEVVSRAHLPGSLACLTAGPAERQPTRVLSSGAMEAALASLRQSHLVIVDSPPVLPLADAGVLGAHADALLVVVRPDMVTTGLLDELRARLAQAGATVLGVVVNAADPGIFEASGAYGYGYGYGYGEGRGRHSERERQPSRFLRMTRDAG